MIELNVGEDLVKILTVLSTAFALTFTPGFAATTPLDDRDCAGTLRDFIVAYLDRHRDTAYPRDPTIRVVMAKLPLERRA